MYCSDDCDCLDSSVRRAQDWRSWGSDLIHTQRIFLLLPSNGINWLIHKEPAYYAVSYVFKQRTKRDISSQMDTIVVELNAGYVQYVLTIVSYIKCHNKCEQCHRCEAIWSVQLDLHWPSMSYKGMSHIFYPSWLFKKKLRPLLNSSGLLMVGTWWYLPGRARW